MGRDRDQVAEACDALAGYMQTLEGLVGEPSARGPSPGMRCRAAHAPEPYRDAGRALMTAHEGIRRLLAWVQFVVAGHPGPKMPGSDEITRRVFAQLPRSAAGLPGEDEVGMVIRYLDRLIREAQGVHGIDEVNRIRHLPRQGDPNDPAALPPMCPYCKTFFLLFDEDAGLIYCSVYGCQDTKGFPPMAELGTDDQGRPTLDWADGRRQVAPVMSMAG